MSILPFGAQEERVESYPYTDEERKFVSGVYQQFQKCYTLKAEPLDILGTNGNGATSNLQDYWNLSVQDYAVLADAIRDPNDPVEQYQSTIARDKTDVFIASLTSQLLYPDVLAQNSDQDIDKVISRVGSAILEWQYKNDGWPAESGQQKSNRYVHKSAVEGTCFVLDAVTREGLESELIPNEEIFLNTFWEPNLQKHNVIFRAKLNMLYDQAEQLFGHMDNWKYVGKGSWIANWYNEAPFLKDGWQGIEWDDRIQILYVWKRATPAELKELKKAKKVKASAKRACFYNVLLNDVPMFPIDNLSPYKHGFFPINVLKLFEFAKPEFIFGQSVGGKIREDKRWIDAWKTLLRYKAKLGLLKPSLVIGGTVDEEILLPSKMTSVEAGLEIRPIEGIADGISGFDIQMLQMAENEIDRGTVSPQSAGQSAERKETARASVIMAANAEKMFDTVSQHFADFQSSRSMPVLLASFQMLTKSDLKKIAIPDQQLSDGTRGSFEVIFQDPGEMTKEEEMQASFDLMNKEGASKKNGVSKEIAMVNPKYLDDIKFYVTSDAASLLQDKSIMKMQAFEKILPIALQNPDLADRKAAFREYLRMNDVTERILAKDTPQAPPHGAGQPPTQQGGLPSPQEPQQPPADALLSQMSQQVTGEKMPSL